MERAEMGHTCEGVQDPCRLNAFLVESAGPESFSADEMRSRIQRSAGSRAQTMEAFAHGLVS